MDNLRVRDAIDVSLVVQEVKHVLDGRGHIGRGTQHVLEEVIYIFLKSSL